MEFLRPRTPLLVLDNLEHLVDGSQLLGEVVEEAPGVALLATSRERLGIQAEWVLDVDGLQVSGDGDRRDGGAAVRLFVERARQADPSFALTAETRPQVTRICRLAEGMPLGIELAATWTSTLPCTAIADEIEHGLDFLSTTARDVPRSTPEPVGGLRPFLAAPDRRGSAGSSCGLSVFRGGFTREGAVAVAGADLRTLSDLAGKSLVRRLELGRFEFHESCASTPPAGSPRPRNGAPGARRPRRYHLGRLRSRQTDLLGPRVAGARDELATTSRTSGPRPSGLRCLGRRRGEGGPRGPVPFLFVHGEHEGGRDLERIAAAQEAAAVTGERGA